MIEIVKTGPLGIPTFAQGAMTDAFLLGKAAMYLDATFISGAGQGPQQIEGDGKSRLCSSIPSKSKYSTENGRLGIAIPANSTKKEAAFPAPSMFHIESQDQKIARLGACQRMSTLKDPGMQKEYPDSPPSWTI